MEKERKEKEALVTCRVLFYSVLDKIYLVLFAIYFVFGLFNGLFMRLRTVGAVFGYYVGFLVGAAIMGLLMNWFYRCAIKSMLCITEDEVYKESYAPLKRSETSIPLNKITSVTTFNFFWIFRSIIIFQYHQLPVVFFTWNNQEFKDKFDELVNKRKANIKNEFEEKNIISFIDKKHYSIIGAITGGVVLVFVIIAIIMSFTNPSNRVIGTYSEGDKAITLNKDSSCTLTGFEDISNCSWSYDQDLEVVTVKYTYDITSSYLGKRSYDKTISLNYSKNTLVNGSKTYTKKK